VAWECHGCWLPGERIPPSRRVPRVEAGSRKCGLLGIAGYERKGDLPHCFFGPAIVQVIVANRGVLSLSSGVGSGCSGEAEMRRKRLLIGFEVGQPKKTSFQKASGTSVSPVLGCGCGGESVYGGPTHFNTSVKFITPTFNNGHFARCPGL
jgi:hypothetical protein